MTDSEPLVETERLTAFIASTSELSPLLPILSVERIGHGQSNLTFRVTLAGGSVILRRPPPGPLPPKAHDVLREYRVMDALLPSPVPVPRAILACADPDVLGAPFFLMEDSRGEVITDAIPAGLLAFPDAGKRIAEAAVDALAALHMLDPGEVGLADLSRPTGYVERQVRLWQGQLDYARVRAVPDLDWTSRWLASHLPEDVDRPSIVHGDYRLDNTIFASDPPPTLLGVVDWEMAALGDPLADLGWLLAFWCEAGTPPPELTILPRLTESDRFPRRWELAARYAERTERDLPDLRFYVVLALWKMAILLEAHWARHVRGTAGDFDFGYLQQGGPIMAAYIRRVADGQLETTKI